MKKKESKPKITLSKLPNAKSKGLHSTILGSTSKKLTPASIGAQKTWQGFPLGLKKELRKNLRDSDRDGVPNGFDCRSKNKRKQESFLSQDMAYIGANQKVEINDCLGAGTFGAVYTIKGNDCLVVKIPNGFRHTYSINQANIPKNTPSTRKNRANYNQRVLNEEYQKSVDGDFDNKPLFVPTRQVNIGNGGMFSHDYTGLIRPKLRMIIDNDGEVDKQAVARITVSQLERMRQDLIRISKEGYVFDDGLQIGMYDAGRLLIYDLGGVTKLRSEDIFMAIKTNDLLWKRFLEKTGKYKIFSRDGVTPGIDEDADRSMMERLRSARARKLASREKR